MDRDERTRALRAQLSDFRDAFGRDAARALLGQMANDLREETKPRRGPGAPRKSGDDERLLKVLTSMLEQKARSIAKGRPVKPAMGLYSVTNRLGSEEATDETARSCAARLRVAYWRAVAASEISPEGRLTDLILTLLLLDGALACAGGAEIAALRKRNSPVVEYTAFRGG
jgi:hypothetical protein